MVHTLDTPLHYWMAHLRNFGNLTFEPLAPKQIWNVINQKISKESSLATCPGHKLVSDGQYLLSIDIHGHRRINVSVRCNMLTLFSLLLLKDASSFLNNF